MLAVCRRGSELPAHEVGELQCVWPARRHVSAAARPTIHLGLILLHAAREQGIIADGDFEAVTYVLLGGLLTYALRGLMVPGQEAQPPALDRADAVVEIILCAVT
jgi:hypothetical protein